MIVLDMSPGQFPKPPARTLPDRSWGTLAAWILARREVSGRFWTPDSCRTLAGFDVCPAVRGVCKTPDRTPAPDRPPDVSSSSGLGESPFLTSEAAVKTAIGQPIMAAGCLPVSPSGTLGTLRAGCGPEKASPGERRAKVTTTLSQ